MTVTCKTAACKLHGVGRGLLFDLSEASKTALDAIMQSTRLQDPQRSDANE